MLRTLRRCARDRHDRAGRRHSSSSQRPAYRAVFISDVHLGLRVSQVIALCDFLEQYPAAELFLVGDIVDFWALARRPYKAPGTVRLLRTLRRLSRQGTRLVMIPGNHDEQLRRLVGREAIELHQDCIHVDANGRRLLVTHGDQADSVVTCHPLLSRFGSVLYDLAVLASMGLNLVRRLGGLGYWNFAGTMKRLVKRACTYVGEWEDTLAAEVRSRGLDGVICGHIHVPRIGEVAGLPYFNCGDWVEHGTALIEHWDGTFELKWAHAPERSRRRLRRALRLRRTRSGIKQPTINPAAA